MRNYLQCVLPITINIQNSKYVMTPIHTTHTRKVYGYHRRLILGLGIVQRSITLIG